MAKKTSTRGKKKPRPRRTPNHEAGKQEAAALRRIKALDLRIEGKSFRKIATELDISLGQAYDDVDSALEEVEALKGKKAERLREVYMERIEAIVAGHFNRATETFDIVTKDDVVIKAGPDDKSARVILAAIERGAKLTGIDAPEKHEHGPATLDEYLAAVYSKRKAQAEQ